MNQKQRARLILGLIFVPLFALITAPLVLRFISSRVSAAPRGFHPHVQIGPYILQHDDDGKCSVTFDAKYQERTDAWQKRVDDDRKANVLLGVREKVIPENEKYDIRIGPGAMAKE